MGLIVGVIAVTDVAILFNVPVLRQISGIIFLTFLPGLLFLFLFRLQKLEIVEKIALTVGLSIFFLMLYGLLINQVGLFFGDDTPLSTGNLTLWLNLALVALLVAAYFGNREAFTSNPFRIELNTRGKLCLLLPAAFPLLGILGMRLLNTSGDNVVLLGLLFLVPVAVIIISLFRKEIASDTYPVAIIFIGVALLIIPWLRSEYVMGADIHYEYYLSNMTLSNLHWSIIDNGPVDSMLGVTLLPAIYQSLLQVQGKEYLFQGIYTLICTFTPLAVYVLSRKYLGEFYAFLAAFFFMLQTTFLISPVMPRVGLALFFVALTLMVLFHDRISGRDKLVLSIIFTAATVVSHYSTTYMFFVLLLLTWLLGLGLRKYYVKKAITLPFIGIFYGFVILWYAQLTQAPFMAGVTYVLQALRHLQDIFVVEARSSEALLLIGQGLQQEIFLVHVKYWLTWVTFALIAFGVVFVLLRYKKLLSTPQWGSSSPGWLASRLDIEYLILVLVAGSMLLASVIEPHLSQVYGLRRVYGQMLPVLSTFFIIGVLAISRHWRTLSYWLILLIAILYFWLESGFAYEVFGFHRNVYLSSQATYWDSEVVHVQEVASAQWAREYFDGQHLVYADNSGRGRLVSEGQLPLSSLELLTGAYWLGQKEINGYIYACYYNVVDKRWMLSSIPYDLSDLPDIFERRDKLYTSNGSEIWK